MLSSLTQESQRSGSHETSIPVVKSSSLIKTSDLGQPALTVYPHLLSNHRNLSSLSHSLLLSLSHKNQTLPLRFLLFFSFLFVSFSVSPSLCVCLTCYDFQPKRGWIFHNKQRHWSVMDQNNLVPDTQPADGIHHKAMKGVSLD